MKVFVLSIKNNDMLGWEDYEDITLAENIDDAAINFLRQMPSITEESWDKESLKEHIKEHK